MTITCQQFIEWLSDYLDQDLDPALAEAVREHAAICAPCLVVLDTTQASVHLLGDERNFAMPEGAKQRLRIALERGLEEPLLAGGLRPAAVTPATIPVTRPAAVPKRGQGKFGWHSAGARLRWAGVAAVVTVVAAISLAHWDTTVVTASGWLVDQHCISVFESHPQDHPKDCLLRCADSVYGILDGKGHFTPFDSKANSKVVAALKASDHKDHFWATVKATRSDGEAGEVLQVEQIALSQGSR